MNHAFPRQPFLGLSFDLADQGQVLSALAAALAEPAFRFVVTPNVDHVVRLHDHADRDEALGQDYRQAWLTLCDSRILALLGQWSRVHLPVVPGSDLTAALLRDRRFAGRHCLVIGGSAATVSALSDRFPDMHWSQFVPPPGVLQDPDAQRRIVDTVLERAADIVFMAIGFPQSEKVCAHILATGRARGIGLCIGASLEFLTGEKRRAPGAFQRLRLEWLYRLISEPRRLWRRYLVVGPRIFRIWRAARR